MLELLEKLKEKSLLVGGISFTVIVTLFSLISITKPSESNSDFSEMVAEVPAVKESKSEEMTTETTVTISSILVDVKGAVIREGLYELPAEARVNDAIKKAGGFSEQADRKSVNLAQKLSDEAIVYVAYQGEEMVAIATNSNGVETGTSSGKVSLNKATVADLTTISGIGEKRAKDIIAYREEHGKFKSIDELSNVSGIGAKTLERLQSEVVLD